MIEASLAVQIAITAALATAGGVGAPVSDQIAESTMPPYVQTGDDQVVPNPAEGFDLSVTVHSKLHAFVGRTQGRRAVKAIAQACVVALDNAALDLTANGWVLNVIRHDGTVYLSEPDGVSHAVISFISLLDPA